GDIGAGHTVTALYELVPADAEMPVPEVDQNPFLAKPAGPAARAAQDSNALFRLRLRYKQPDGDTSELIEEDVEDAGLSFAAASPDFQWASAVAAFGMLLRDSQYKGGITLEAVAEIAKAAKGEDPHGYRAQFLELIKLAQRLMRRGC
ncbi:MAG: DUF3520 domain-containing protein, partial [Planctomycetota bacterium]|nr:DUF3520 domain-containing protein [Planctomycetota bacterium]